jgi:hypothetical protein
LWPINQSIVLVLWLIASGEGKTLTILSQWYWLSLLDLLLWVYGAIYSVSCIT